MNAAQHDTGIEDEDARPLVAPLAPAYDRASDRSPRRAGTVGTVGTDGTVGTVGTVGRGVDWRHDAPRGAPHRQAVAHGRRSVNEPALWTISINAFGAVMALLSLLAGVVWLLTVIFSPPASAAAAVPTARASTAPLDAAGLEDVPLIAAIHATVRQVLPGGIVSRIEEVR